MYTKKIIRPEMFQFDIEKHPDKTFMNICMTL